MKPPSQMELLAALDIVRRWLAAGNAAPVDDWVDAADAPVPQRTIRDAVRRGELTGSRAGRRLLVRRSELDRWIETRRAKPRKADERVNAVLVQMGGRRAGGAW